MLGKTLCATLAVLWPFGSSTSVLTPLITPPGTPGLLDWLRPQDPALLLRFAVSSLVVGLSLYLSIGGFLYRRYYLQRRDQPAAWKCQPRRWPTARMRSYDLRLGLFNLTIGSLLSGSCAYLAVRGHTAVAFSVSEHGPALTALYALIYFFGVDFFLYAAHRMYHRPRLFRAIHRFHHRNTTPTPFTAYSMHPVEFLTFEAVALVPMFFLPVHALVVIATLVYSNYVALLQHSGVRLSSVLPWQPATRFHDDHHLCFHVNYGQNLMLWDRLFGTLRRHGRRYGVEVFGGRGAALAGAVRSAGGDGADAGYFDYRRDPGPSEPLESGGPLELSRPTGVSVPARRPEPELFPEDETTLKIEEDHVA